MSTNMVYTRLIKFILPILPFIPAVIFRFINPLWDGGTISFHSDERLITAAALHIRFFSELNPGFLDYNGLPVYILRLAYDVFSPVLDAFVSSDPLTQITCLGRIINAAISTYSIYLVYRLSVMLFNRWVGYVAALFLAYSVLPIQQAHFYTTDSYMLMFSVLIGIYSVRYFRKPDTKRLFFLSCISGFALGTKNTAYLLLAIPLALLILSGNGIKTKIRSITAYMGLTLVVFFISSPYVFLRFQEYLHASRYLSGMVAGSQVYGWTLQFVNSTPFLTISNIFYGFGPILPVYSIAGLISSFIFGINKRSLTLLAVTFWSIGYLLFISLAYVKFIRYLMPVAGYLCIFCAFLCYRIHLTNRRTGSFITVSGLSVSIIYVFLFVSIYTVKHPLVSAKEFVIRHIPADKIICREENNTLIPNDKAEFDSGHNYVSFDFFQPDSPQKMSALADFMERCDYFVITGKRVYRTVGFIPEIFSGTGMFYSRLFSGSAGFRLEADFPSYPGMIGQIINDENSEETFTDFDHPKVYIFRKLQPSTD